MTIDDLDDCSIDGLLTYYENACKTYCDAIGHNKSHWNEMHANRYAKELTARGEPVPDMYVAAKRGTFNGIGAY